jgi:hypothetical protein
MAAAATLDSAARGAGRAWPTALAVSSWGEPENPMHNVDHILESLATRTQRVFDTALGAERHQLLTRRLYQLYGALELARLLEHSRLARRIETQVDACRRNIEADSGTAAS